MIMSQVKCANISTKKQKKNPVVDWTNFKLHMALSENYWSDLIIDFVARIHTAQKMKVFH